MKQRLSGIITLLLVLVVQMSFAQEMIVKGVVTDAEGVPLPGVNVIVKNTDRGVQTNFEGEYTIRASSGEILVYSYLGFTTAEYPVGDTPRMDVILTVDAAELEEVIVLGYRTSTKEKSSIASTTITAATIENRPNPSIVQTLSGQVAGLNIVTSTGQPGGNSTVNLRGITSINGNTEPLFIIDGIPVDEDNFRSLNPNDIASISVLKDAGATAIYGNRGANGVVLIETKQGAYNTPLQIHVSTTLSFSELQDEDFMLMDSQQQLMLERELGVGRGASLTDEEIAAATTTEWLDYFFRTGMTTNNNIAFSSGGSRSSQFTSLGFMDTEGILKQSSLKRFNVRNNLSGRTENEKFNYSSNISINYSTSDEPNEIGSGAVNRNYVLGAFQSVPYISPRDYTSGADLVENFGGFADTPLLLIDRLRTFMRVEEEVKLLGSFTAAYNLTEDLVLETQLSADYENAILTAAQGPESFNSLYFAEDGNETPGFQDQQTSRQFTFNQVTSLNYGKSWGEHTLSAGAYVEYFKAHFRGFGFRASGLNPATFYPGDGSGFVSDNSDNDYFTDAANANILNAGLFSYFGNLDYDFGERFGLAGTIRRDASYRFAASNRWGTFYAVSGRWNIHNEDFMEDSSVFDVLKIRGSYGTAGNQRITGDSYFSGPDLTESFYATGTGYEGENALFLSQIGNNTLTWEVVTSANVGIDFEMFDSRLRGSVDGYVRETTDLFQDTPVSAINAITSLRANVGSLKNTGVDLALNYDIVRGANEGLYLTVGAVANYNETEILDLPTEEGFIESIGREGGKLFEYYTIRYAGVNPSTGNLLFYTADGDVTENPDADADRVWTGKNIYPDFTGSFNFRADYKGFFVSSQWNFVTGVDRYAFDIAGFQDPTSAGSFRLSQDLLRAWTVDNRITDIPALRATNINTFASTRYLRSADYLRLRFATIGYSVPDDYLDGTGFDTVSLFANGENLLTFSEWRGLDPEAFSNGSNGYPTPRIISFGVEFEF